MFGHARDAEEVCFRSQGDDQVFEIELATALEGDDVALGIDAARRIADEARPGQAPEDIVQGDAEGAFQVRSIGLAAGDGGYLVECWRVEVVGGAVDDDRLVVPEEAAPREAAVQF